MSLVGETEVRRWLTSVRLRPQPPGVHVIELLAFTDGGVELVASSWSLAELERIPPDRLALGPVTNGGAVATHGSRGVRAVCTDLDGTHSVWWSPGPDTGDCQSMASDLVPVGDMSNDCDSLRLLRRLLNPQATRPTTTELAARLLLWAVLDSLPATAATLPAGCTPDPLSTLEWSEAPPVWGPGPPMVPPHRVHVRPGYWPGEADPLAAAVGALATRRPRVLADLVAVRLPDEPTPHELRNLACAVGHPDPDWTGLVHPDDTLAPIDVLHAFIPTRWMLAGELRNRFDRPELAALVLSAPPL